MNKVCLPCVVWMICSYLTIALWTDKLVHDYYDGHERLFNALGMVYLLIAAVVIIGGSFLINKLTARLNK